MNFNKDIRFKKSRILLDQNEDIIFIRIKKMIIYIKKIQ